KHAEKLISRILFLEGSPNMSELFPIRVGDNVQAQIENDLALELEAIPRLKTAIRTCLEVADDVSRELFEQILEEEEEHVDYLEAQLHIIGEIGLPNYLAQFIHG
ncbi:MAG: bacterioferritin, partial [Acidobacteria bacterium]|nr:bacterioferritin [Acidobacteriota bacterium]